jgi:hypothetical protein
VERHLDETIGARVLDWLAAVPASALYSVPSLAIDALGPACQAASPDHPHRHLLTTRLTTVLRLLERYEDLVTQGTGVLPEISDPALLDEVAWNVARGLGAAGRFAEQDTVILQVIGGRMP